jgi:BirA family biotin operon repressor/biotin-[acetyl-CoA-carboxylase] ligase
VTVGRPRRHLRETTSTNELARTLAAAGAPHGTLVTAGYQTAGRGRQGRTWTAPAGRALLLSLIVRELDPLLPLRAGLAVADLAGESALVKWPNDVLVDGRKVAGVLIESRPQEGWTVVGIGVNVALDLAGMPPELRATAGTLGRRPADLEAALLELLGHLERRFGEAVEDALRALRDRDALLGRTITWTGGEGIGAGIDEDGALRVRLADGSETKVSAGEVTVSPSG